MFFLNHGVSYDHVDNMCELPSVEMRCFGKCAQRLSTFAPWNSCFDLIFCGTFSQKISEHKYHFVKKTIEKYKSYFASKERTS